MQIQVEEIQRLVREAGFDMFGILPLSPSVTVPALQEWLSEGMQGSMDWMAREDAVIKRADPRAILPSAQSLITLAFRYMPEEIPDALLNDPSRGIIARYALYDDYHVVIQKQMDVLVAALQGHPGIGSCEWKAYVDTGPFLEREWAQRAGLGFIGRNSNLIHFNLGSYLFLSEILVSVALPEFIHPARGSCARCTNCMDACPTGAIVADKTVDARKCISYITIEHKGAIPEWMRPLMKNRIYGCDICQEVCPWNGVKPPQQKKYFQVREDLVAPKLDTLLFFDDESFRERFRKSPIKRAKREGFMRNVSIALGNWGSTEARTLLQQIFREDPSALVREHAAWGLRQI